MNLRAIANAATRRVNPNVPATLRRSTGYTTSESGRRTPSYANEAVEVQVQALTTSDLRLLDSLNIQGATRSVYMNGAAAPVVRDSQQGGDLFVFDAGVLGPTAQTWLCTQVIEQWPDWCKVAITLQNGS